MAWVAVTGLAACGPNVVVPDGANSGDGTGSGESDTDAEPTASMTGGMDPTQSGADPGSSTGSADSSGGESSSTGSDEAEWVPDARDEFQTYADLYEKVIQRTCSPFNNVCHSNMEVPDMTEMDSLFGSIGVPCRSTRGLCIAPGSPQDSALFLRVTGEADGIPMPLANQPLTDAELGAIACWIETLQVGVEPQVGDIIDYDNCLYAAQTE